MKTITKREYLKECVRQRKGITKREWYIKAFTIPTLIDEDHTKLEPFDLCIKSDGLYTVGIEHDPTELFKINDYKINEPLYINQEGIEVDQTVMKSIKGKVETTVGRLLINAIVFPKHLEHKMDYINSKMDSSTIEGQIERRVKNDDEKKDANSITVSEMIEIVDSLNFFDSIGTIMCTAASPKTITRTPGIDEYVKKLIEEAGDEIHNPVKRVEIEDKVRAFSKEYTKGDVVAENLFGRKASVALFKMYGMYGAGLDFVHDRSNDTLVIDPISEGINPTPEDLPKYFNDLRYASFSRGDNTALAGAVYKDLQRSINTIKITPTPCKTSRGIIKVITPQEANYSLGRFIKQGNKWVTLNSIDEVKKLIGKEVEMRSPFYCKEKGPAICYACMSARYKNLANGAANMAAYISDTLLNMFLKLMHGVQTNTTEIEKEDLIN